MVKRDGREGRLRCVLGIQATVALAGSGVSVTHQMLSLWCLSPHLGRDTDSMSWNEEFRLFQTHGRARRGDTFSNLLIVRNIRHLYNWQTNTGSQKWMLGGDWLIWCDDFVSFLRVSGSDQNAFMRFKTTAKDGLLLWRGDSPMRLTVTSFPWAFGMEPWCSGNPHTGCRQHSLVNFLSQCRS